MPPETVESQPIFKFPAPFAGGRHQQFRGHWRRTEPKTEAVDQRSNNSNKNSNNNNSKNKNNRTTKSTITTTTRTGTTTNAGKQLMTGTD